MTKSTSLQSLVLIAMSAAIIAVLSQLSISLGPIPLTLQTFAVGLMATLLRTKEASLSVLIYLLLGAVGLPVFAGGGSGFQALLGPASGFLWGFVVYAIVTSTLTSAHSPLWRIFVTNILGDSFVFILGALVYAFHLKISLMDSFTAVVLPFLLADTIKIVLITLMAPLLAKALSTIEYFQR